MTYANDCIGMRDRDRRRGLKHIEEHTDAELDAAVEAARRRFGDDFWLLLLLLHGVDAYQERRRRKQGRRISERMMRDVEDVMALDNMWGQDG